MKRKDMAKQDKSHVLMLFGGESSEHDVSMASAGNVYKAIDRNMFDVTLGYIDIQGRWWLVSDIAGNSPANDAQLMPVLGRKSFSTIGGDLITPDAILPILHGRNGEDGSVQGLCQLLHIPVVGCDMTASAICMDKIATKEILHANGVPTVPYKAHREGEAIPDYDMILEELGTVLFIKPSRAGSSVGVSKVTTKAQFVTALKAAHEHDEVVLIERGISGCREIEVAALGNPPHHEVSGIGEIITGDEFYSYDAKYSQDSTSKVVIPAELDEKIAEHIRSLAHRAYGILGCRGLARIDFFLDEAGEIYLNEVNTIPGFTDISMYPKLWQQEGVSYTKLVSRLILLALNDTIRTE